MNAGGSIASGTSFSQAMVNQGPRYDRKWKRRSNQVMGKSGIIRPDKRKKSKYL
jgi:hypothetical protein